MAHDSNPTTQNKTGTVKRLLFRVFETALALLLVLGFSMTSLIIIGFAFPEGSGLRDLVLHPKWTSDIDSAHRLDFDLGEERGRTSAIVARLVETRRIVKAKDSQSIVWNQAQSGMDLGDRDSLQTFDRSRALVSFGNDNELSLDENSLVVIRRPRRISTARSEAPSMLMLGGALGVHTDEDPTEAVPLEILTANGSTVTLSEEATGSRLRVTVNPDKTSTFSLTSGTAQVVSAGQSVTLTANRTITVDGFSAPDEPTALPGGPSVLAPVDGLELTYRSIPPRVQFNWQHGSDADAHRLVIARDSKLEDVVYEGTIEGTRFSHGNLREGRYYWRVSALAGWAEGPGSPTRRIDILHDDVPPPLQVDFPGEPVSGELVVVKGVTEPGAAVFSGEQRTAADLDGMFELELKLRRGTNILVVEAFDSAGNVSYRSELVNAKF